jgi:small subunit ribosomal protein S8
VDVVGNFLTVLRNAIMVYKRTAVVPYSNLKAEIARVLKEEGFIKDYRREVTGEVQDRLLIYFQYVDGESAIHEIKRMSTPGCRSYKRVSDVKPLLGGLGLAILSTNRGVISDRVARREKVGGEVICHVW